MTDTHALLEAAYLSATSSSPRGVAECSQPAPLYPNPAARASLPGYEPDWQPGGHDYESDERLLGDFEPPEMDWSE
jgi:hypothetical protein